MASKLVFAAVAALLVAAAFASEFEDPNVINLTESNYETQVRAGAASLRFRFAAAQITPVARAESQLVPARFAMPELCFITARGLRRPAKAETLTYSTTGCPVK